MISRRHPAARLVRVSDVFLPIALMAATLSGHGAAALGLFVSLYAVKLCALATADGLRATFASQPSMKYVQGSASLALLLQLPGAALAALITHFIPSMRSLLPLIPCGLLLSIEHVFYEYLYAVGDKNSATLSRCITAVLTLVGLLLSAPPDYGPLLSVEIEPTWPLVTTGLSALVGLVISLSLGGRVHAVFNAGVLRRAPLSMVQTALCPALTLAVLASLWPASFNPAPLFAGLALYQACRTPFRRTPMESGPMNALLLCVCAACVACGTLARFLLKGPVSDAVVMTCVALLIAALCAFALFGSIRRSSD